MEVRQVCQREPAGSEESRQGLVRFSGLSLPTRVAAISPKDAGLPHARGLVHCLSSLSLSEAPVHLSSKGCSKPLSGSKDLISNTVTLLCDSQKTPDLSGIIVFFRVVNKFRVVAEGGREVSARAGSMK